jgi:hypothetical protein
MTGDDGRPAARSGSGQHRPAAVFRALAAGPGQAGGGLLAEAVAGGLQIDESMVACSLTSVTGDHFETLTFTSEAALELDHLQYRARSGPCVTAAAQRRRCLVAGPGGPWRAVPGWAHAADRFGVRGVLSVPLPGDRHPAGLNLYAAGPAGLDAPVVTARAELIGRLISRLLAGLGGPLREPGPAPGQLSPSVAARRALMDRARDTLAGQEQVTAGEAFARLARRSADEARSIFDIARDVVQDGAADTEAAG